MALSVGWSLSAVRQREGKREKGGWGRERKEEREGEGEGQQGGKKPREKKEEKQVCLCRGTNVRDGRREACKIKGHQRQGEDEMLKQQRLKHDSVKVGANRKNWRRS